MSTLSSPFRSQQSLKPMSQRARWFGGNMPVARVGLILNLLLPLALLVWDALHNQLGPDPVNHAILITGFLAVTCLLLSLCVTPLRVLTGWTWLIQFRRSLGVFAFYYACCHLSIFFWWDRGRNLGSTVQEITHRWYLMIGFLSLVLMAPLWATSFNAAIRWMGGMHWKQLHKLVYLAAILACIHFYMQSKADKSLPLYYFYVLGGLFLWRFGVWQLREWRAGGKPVDMPALPVVCPGKTRFWRGELKVIGMFHETDSVRTFRLAPGDDSPIPFAFKAGQFLNLFVDIAGKRTSRSYTIASPPTRDGYIELTIKREEKGQVSTFLHDMLMTGQAVAITAPAGRFTFDSKSADAVLLIAGGVGITPVMSILRDLTDRGFPGKIDLLFSVRTPDDLIFAEELRYLGSRYPNFKLHVTVTHPKGVGSLLSPGDRESAGVPTAGAGAVKASDPSGPFLSGRIDAEMVRRVVPDAAGRPAFICGPDAMEAAAREVLLEVGVPASRIMVESFTPAGAVAADNAAMPDDVMRDAAIAATVTFAHSGRSAPLPLNRSILDAADAVGVSIDSQCRSGICGTCRCKLLSGHVTMPVREALSDADEADGFILACQAHATEDVTVDA